MRIHQVAFSPAIVAVALLLTAGALEAEVEWIEQAKLVASDYGPGENFGQAVAIDGDRLAVSAPDADGGAYRSGAVYVFEREGPGDWIEVAKLIAPDPQAGAALGLDMSLSGDVAAATAVQVDDGDGAAYVWERDPATGNWRAAAKLRPPEDQGGNGWGHAVTVHGDTVVVGAIFDDEGASNAGAAFVFERVSDGSVGWGWAAKLIAPDATTNDQFGGRLDLDGDRLVVGAPEAPGLDSQSGAAYLFERGPDGAWSNVARLQASDELSDEFGAAVALDGDRLLVGAYNQDVLGLNNAGAAYVFERSESGEWLETAQLIAADVEQGDHFGRDVDLEQDRLIVGANGNGPGMVYVFEPDGDGGWIQVAELTDADGDNTDNLGRSSGLSGTTVVAGARGADIVDPPDSNEGAAYVWARVSPEIALEGACPGDVTLTLTGAAPGGLVGLLWGDAEGLAVVPEGRCEGTEVGLEEPRPLTVERADGGGEIVVTGAVGPGSCGRLVQAVDGESCLVSGVAALP